MLTMLEDMRLDIPGLAEAPSDGPDRAYYVWAIPGYAESPEVVRSDEGEGYWATPEEAYADLQAYLLSGHKVMPSTGQIVVWFAFRPYVTHVVRIG